MNSGFAAATGQLTLTDPERKRVAHAQRLSSQGPQGVKELVSLLTDPSWVVRRAIVSALASSGKDGIDALCDVLKNHRDSEARLAAAVDALVAASGPVEESVLKLVDLPEPAVIADAVQVLGRRRSEKALPVLIRLTRHESDIVAVGAIEALGRIGGRAAVEALVETVGSGNFFRTFPAIDVLGRSGDPRAIEPLVKLLANPTYLLEAARALGRSGERAAVKPLAELLKSPSDAIIRVTACALWDLRERHEEKSGDGLLVDELIRSELAVDSIRRLTRVLPGADVNEGVAVCRLLGIVGSLEAAAQLTLALDGPTQIASCAAESLRRLGKDADDHLVQAIREGSSARRRVLLPLVTRSAAAGEVTRCLTDPDPEVRALACDTLARLGNGATVSNVFQLLADSNPRVVHAATAAIQALGTREARQLAVEAAKSRSPGIRRSALRILGYFGDGAALQPMLDGLTDEDARVREAAIQGLPYLEDSRALEALIQEARSQQARTRGMAIRSLGQVPRANERIHAILLKGLSDADPWVRYYSCQSVGRLGYSQAATEVAALLEDEAGQVRVSAVEALSHLESHRAHEALRTATASQDPDVRRAALLGLGMANRNEDLPLVLAATSAPDVPTRLIALSSIVNFSSAEVLKALSAAGHDADEQVSSAAIGFLAARPEIEATRVLVELLDVEATRERARAALLVPGQSRVAGLLGGLESASDEQAPTLIAILARIERPAARQALLAAMKVKNVAARKAAASALASRRDPQMNAALRDAAEHDPDESVRKICTLLLRD